MPNQLDKFQQRSGEKIVSQFSRSGRFFCADSQWFFKTREGLDYGPYASRTECKYAYAEFIDVVNGEGSFGVLPLEYEDSATDWQMPKIKFN